MSSLHCRFLYTAPSNGVLRVYTVGSTFDILLAVYVSTDGTIGGLSAGMFSDDCGGFTSCIQRDAIAFTTYAIQVAGYSNSRGNYVVMLTLST